ncbi:MAG: hypothetical protein MMC23_001068 [Stictis urceolatum]|nr:hypothetical protein [Stictis urceolata]
MPQSRQAFDGKQTLQWPNGQTNSSAHGQLCPGSVGESNSRFPTELYGNSRPAATGNDSNLLASATSNSFKDGQTTQGKRSSQSSNARQSASTSQAISRPGSAAEQEQRAPLAQTHRPTPMSYPMQRWLDSPEAASRYHNQHFASSDPYHDLAGVSTSTIYESSDKQQNGTNSEVKED